MIRNKRCLACGRFVTASNGYECGCPLNCAFVVTQVRSCSYNDLIEQPAWVQTSLRRWIA